MKLEYIRNDALEVSQLEEIIAFKDQQWTHGFESQKKWIQSHFKNDDFHLLLRDKNKLIAYTGINKIECVADDSKIPFWGIGNVCVRKDSRGQGCGKALVLEANKWIDNQREAGILLCHLNLVDFYSRVSWQELSYAQAFVEGQPFHDHIMTLGFPPKPVNTICIDKNF